MSKFEHNGFVYHIVAHTGWCHVYDPKNPGVWADKCDVTEIIRRMKRSEDVEKAVAALRKVRGIGPLAINRILAESGWKAGYIKIFEA